MNAVGGGFAATTAAATRARNTEFVRGGFRAVKRFFKQEKVRFAGAAPVLLIQPGGKQVNKQESLASRQMQSIFMQHLGLKTIVSQAGHASFPMETRVQQKLDLAQRIGASTICGVGDRSTLDLAKAVAAAAASGRGDDSDDDYQRRRHVVDHLILIPHTYDAVLSCTHPYAFLLHEEEDVLLMQNCSDSKKNKSKNKSNKNNNEDVDEEDESFISERETTVGFLDLEAFWNRDSYKQTEALRACWAVLLDALHRCDALHNPEVLDVAEPLMHQIQSDIQQRQQRFDHDQTTLEEAHQRTIDTIVDVGSEFLHFGLDDNNESETVRSAPLAIAASLLPLVLAEAEKENNSNNNNVNKNNRSNNSDNDLLVLMAATLPVLLQKTQQQLLVPDEKHPNQDHPPPPPFLTNESVQSLYQSTVRQNQLLNHCRDAPKKELQELLQPFSLLPHSSKSSRSSS